MGEYVFREGWILWLSCFIFVSVKERKCLRYKVTYLFCYHEASKCLDRIHFVLKVKLKGFFVFLSAWLSLQKIKQTPFVVLPSSGVLLFPLYLSGYLFSNKDIFFPEVFFRGNQLKTPQYGFITLIDKQNCVLYNAADLLRVISEFSRKECREWMCCPYPSCCSTLSSLIDKDFWPKIRSGIAAIHERMS